MKVREKAKKLIDEIRPYYAPERMEKFRDLLKFLPKPEITHKEKALKGHVANYEVPIVNYKDPLIQLAKTRLVTKNVSEIIKRKDKRTKLNIVLKVKLRKETEDRTIYAEPYFSSISISEIDMELFIEKGLRGGISYIAHRYGKANNKYMSDYNPQEENSYLKYLDANDLYGWAMSQPLPFGDFKWLEFDFLGKD